MEHPAVVETQACICSVCGSEADSASLLALNDGPTLCVDCYGRCFLSDFDVVFEAD
jgi:hypothetical protein